MTDCINIRQCRLSLDTDGMNNWPRFWAEFATIVSLWLTECIHYSKPNLNKAARTHDLIHLIPVERRSPLRYATPKGYGKNKKTTLIHVSNLPPVLHPEPVNRTIYGQVEFSCNVLPATTVLFKTSICQLQFWDLTFGLIKKE